IVLPALLEATPYLYAGGGYHHALVAQPRDVSPDRGRKFVELLDGGLQFVDALLRQRGDLEDDYRLLGYILLDLRDLVYRPERKGLEQDAGSPPLEALRLLFNGSRRQFLPAFRCIPSLLLKIGESVPAAATRETYTSL